MPFLSFLSFLLSFLFLFCRSLMLLDLFVFVDFLLGFYCHSPFSQNSNTRCNTCSFDATCHNCLCILCATIHFVYALKSKLKEQYYFSIECCFSQFFLAHTISVENVHIITTIIIREKPTAHSLYVCVWIKYS